MLKTPHRKNVYCYEIVIQKATEWCLSYESDMQRIVVRLLPEERDIFLSSNTYRPALGPTQPRIQGVLEHYPRGKAAGVSY